MSKIYTALLGAALLIWLANQDFCPEELVPWFYAVCLPMYMMGATAKYPPVRILDIMVRTIVFGLLVLFPLATDLRRLPILHPESFWIVVCGLLTNAFLGILPPPSLCQAEEPQPLKKLDREEVKDVDEFAAADDYRRSLSWCLRRVFLYPNRTYVTPASWDEMDKIISGAQEF